VIASCVKYGSKFTNQDACFVFSPGVEKIFLGFGKVDFLFFFICFLYYFFRINFALKPSYFCIVILFSIYMNLHSLILLEYGHFV